MGKFYSTKTYGNDRGLSCVFRQHKAYHSHCSQLHGYSIGIKLTFECDELDDRNWVMDFGGMKEFKNWAEYMFDHTVLVAHDDPYLETISNLPEEIANVRVIEAVGCEKFAEMCFDKMSEILFTQFEQGKSLNTTVRVKSVEVFEHEANSAIYERD